MAAPSGHAASISWPLYMICLTSVMASPSDRSNPFGKLGRARCKCNVKHGGCSNPSPGHAHLCQHCVAERQVQAEEGRVLGGDRRVRLADFTRRLAAHGSGTARKVLKIGHVVSAVSAAMAQCSLGCSPRHDCRRTLAAAALGAHLAATACSRAPALTAGDVFHSVAPPCVMMPASTARSQK